MLGKLIRVGRAERGLTAQEVADRAGISRTKRPEENGRVRRRDMPGPVRLYLVFLPLINLVKSAESEGHWCDAGPCLLNGADCSCDFKWPRAFYDAVRFLSSSFQPMMLMVGVHDLSNALNA